MTRCTGSYTRVNLPPSVMSYDAYHGRGRYPCPTCQRVCAVRPKYSNRRYVGTVPAHRAAA